MLWHSSKQEHFVTLYPTVFVIVGSDIIVDGGTCFVKQDEINELSRLILKLMRRIASVNRSYTGGSVGDIVLIDEKRSGLKAPHIIDHLYLSPDFSPWVIVERDTPLWNEVINRLHMTRRNLISRDFAETELQGLVQDCRDKGWKL